MALAHLGENQQAAQVLIAQRLIDQERSLQEQFDRVSMRVSMTVDQAASQTRETLTSLRERLAVVDDAQRNITALSTQMVGLQDILSNKQARAPSADQLRYWSSGAAARCLRMQRRRRGPARRLPLRLPNRPVRSRSTPSSARILSSPPLLDRCERSRPRATPADVLKHVARDREQNIVPVIPATGPR